LVGAAVMIAGVAVLGGVAAGVALIVARAVTVVEEQALEAEAESLEQRLEARLDALDARLARIEEQLHAIEHLRGRQRCRTWRSPVSGVTAGRLLATLPEWALTTSRPSGTHRAAPSRRADLVSTGDGADRGRGRRPCTSLRPA
jgi:hypothetical protein